MSKAKHTNGTGKSRKRNFFEDRARRGADRKQRWKLSAVLACTAAIVIVGWLLLTLRLH